MAAEPSVSILAFSSRYSGPQGAFVQGIFKVVPYSFGPGVKNELLTHNHCTPQHPNDSQTSPRHCISIVPLHTYYIHTFIHTKVNRFTPKFTPDLGIVEVSR